MKHTERLLLVFSVLATLAPLAHVLELPNKFALDGPDWLTVQQHLYRGWGPMLGAPTEFGGLLTGIAILVQAHRDRLTRRAAIVAAAAYAGMIAVFFLLNAPVNAAVAGLTQPTLPPDWPVLRARWEVGHAIAAVLALIGLSATWWGWLQRHRRLLATIPGPAHRDAS